MNGAGWNSTQHRWEIHNHDGAVVFWAVGEVCTSFTEFMEFYWLVRR